MRRPLLAALVIALCTMSGVAAYVVARPAVAGWHEIAWPFPRDGWPAGRAFRCDAGMCGGEVELYVRPKIGFCNCDSGVADDGEVDRVADLDLISERFVAPEPGRVIQVANLSGRIRNYHLEMQDGSRHTAVGIAVSRRCDLLVVAAQSKAEGSGLQRVALDFLAKEDVTRWMTTALDGR
jgi:hypothetical protein